LSDETYDEFYDEAMVAPSIEEDWNTWDDTLDDTYVDYETLDDTYVELEDWETNYDETWTDDLADYDQQDQYDVDLADFDTLDDGSMEEPVVTDGEWDQTYYDDQAWDSTGTEWDETNGDLSVEANTDEYVWDDGTEEPYTEDWELGYDDLDWESEESWDNEYTEFNWDDWRSNFDFTNPEWMYNFDWTSIFPTMYESEGNYWFCDDSLCWYYNEQYGEVVTDRDTYHGPEAFLESYFSGEFDIEEISEAENVQLELGTSLAGAMYGDLRLTGMEFESEDAFYAMFEPTYIYFWDSFIGSSGATVTYHDWQAIWDALYQPIYDELYVAPSTEDYDWENEYEWDDEYVSEEEEYVDTRENFNNGWDFNWEDWESNFDMSDENWYMNYDLSFIFTNEFEYEGQYWACDERENCWTYNVETM
jgi:hypothetical protein